MSATDEERLPPGGFILRHGFPHWFDRAGKSGDSSVLSSRDASRSYGQDLPAKGSQGIGLTLNEAESVQSTQSSTTPSVSVPTTGMDQDSRKITIYQILEYVKRAFSEDDLLDSVPLGAVGNPGAWKAWRAYRASSGVRLVGVTRIGEALDERDEWNWDGVWEQRVRKGIDTSISDSVLYGGTDDLVCPELRDYRQD